MPDDPRLAGLGRKRAPCEDPRADPTHLLPHEGHGGTPRGRSIFPLASSAQGNIQHAASGTWKRLEDILLGLTDGCDRKLRLSSRAA